MTDTTSLLRQSRYSTPGRDVPGLSTHEIKQWCFVIALPLVGILLLICCFLLQGIFAALGPWALFIGVKLFAKKVEKQPSY